MEDLSNLALMSGQHMHAGGQAMQFWHILLASPGNLSCCSQGFFEANLITTLTYAEDASTGNTTIPMYVVQGVAAAIRYACTCLFDPVNSLLAQLMMGSLYGKLTVHIKLLGVSLWMPLMPACQGNRSHQDG